MGCSVSLYRILIKWALPVSSAQLLPATLSLRLGDGPGSRSLLTKQGSQVRGGMSSGSCPRDLVCWGGVPLRSFIGLQTGSKFMVRRSLKVTVIFEVGKVGLGLQAEHLRWVPSPCWHLWTQSLPPLTVTRHPCLLSIACDAHWSVLGEWGLSAL